MKTKTEIKFGSKDLEDHYTCYYCNLAHKKVEAGGMWYCPNIACKGPGGTYYRSKLKGTINKGSTSEVDCIEWRNKVLEDMEIIEDEGILSAIKESLKVLTAHVASDKFLP